MGIYESEREYQEERIERRFECCEPAHPKKYMAVREAKWKLEDCKKYYDNSLEYTSEHSREWIKEDIILCKNGLPKNYNVDESRCRILESLSMGKSIDEIFESEWDIHCKKYSKEQGKDKKNLQDAEKKMEEALNLPDDDPEVVRKYKEWELRKSKAIDIDYD